MSNFRDKIFSEENLNKLRDKNQDKKVKNDEEEVYMTAYPNEKDGYKTVNSEPDNDPWVDCC